jgi:hypothetical protein
VSALDRLGVISRAYEKAADEYRDVALAAATAEAAHKTARAKAILHFKATAERRVSHAEAECWAEANDEVAGLYLERLTTAALADSARQKLAQLREQVGVGRTAAAAERLVDQVHAQGWSGAG